ncbi:hypothetical protein BO221_10275 [Archangium sp. Cb G35]|uniref:phosphatase domain-containing protein n=1 Tax=Archangium sp. Cb G35 TaxID=1920190 RepID=UPI000936B1D1|nr:hypothetical protein [Archangium sp. Cb G35]OJT26278.1 hypothetical protein BO221_10275 [Archangium sp. Cb G35]
MLLPARAPDASFAPLVLDSDEPRSRRFRVSELAGSTTRGGLRCSGSAQFSLAGWEDVQERLGRPAPEHLYVLDLRQESHGFLDGSAVSWYARHNWGCVGLARHEVLQLEALRLRLLEGGNPVWVGDARAVKEGTGPVLTEYKPEQVRTEEQALGLPEGHYVRIPVTDHLRPDDAALDLLVQFVNTLRDGAHLHVHCRGGKGRTSLFLTLIELLWSAEPLELDALLERQQRLNDYDLRKRPAPDSYKAPFAPERMELLTRFHAYARAHPGGGSQTWTQWQHTP